MADFPAHKSAFSLIRRLCARSAFAIGTCALLLGATRESVAAPRESVTFTNIISNGEEGDRTNAVRQTGFQGGYQAAQVHLRGTLRRLNTDSSAGDASIVITSPGGVETYCYAPGEFDSSGLLVIPDTLIEIGDGETVDAQGTWTFRFFEMTDDTGNDASWQTVTLTLDDSVPPPPPPPVAEELGTITSAPVILARTLNADAVLWFHFTISSDVDISRFLDISTLNSTLSGDTEAYDNDTGIALFDSAGQEVAWNDDECSDCTDPLRTSLLSFGVGSGGHSMGQDGLLPAGGYYLAIGAGGLETDSEWYALSYSSAAGTVSLQIRSAVPCQCDPIAIVAQPISVTVNVLEGVEFRVGVNGSSPEYQWQKDERDIAGATGPSLVLPQCTAGDAGRYRVDIRNCCSHVVSAVAVLSVRCPADFNHDNVVDFFDYADFVAAFADGAVSADFNGDGVLDLFDYLDFIAEFSGQGSAACSCPIDIAPPNFGLLQNGARSVVVAWDDVGSCEQHYEIDLSRNGQDYVLVATLPANTTSAALNGLIPSTRYWARIRACRFDGRSWVCGPLTEPPLTFTTVCEPIAAPQNVRICNLWATAADVCWLDASDNEASFQVQRSIDNIVFTTIATLPSNTQRYRVTGLASGTTYWFRILAKGIPEFQCSGVSQSVQATPDCVVAPAGFRVAGIAGNSVCFLWTDNSSCEGRFVVQQSRWNGSSWDPWILGENVPPNRGDACRTDLEYATTYKFRIRAEIVGGRVSPWSAEVQAVTANDCLVAPANLRLASVAGTQVCLLWDDTSSCEDRFVIEQSRWNGSSWDAWVLGENVPPNRGDACRTGLDYATRYRFRIRAEIQGVRASGWSNVLEVNTADDCLQPPGTLHVASVAGDQVCLLWVDTSSCETRFVIEQSRWNGSSWDPWVFGENVPPNRGDACRTGLEYATTYRFRIRAEIEGVRVSGWSNETQATTTADCLQAPSNLRRTARGCGTITLAWDDTSSCETSFELQQSHLNGTTWDAWVFGENVPANAIAAVRDSLGSNPILSGETYKFRIRAVQNGRTSGWSNETAANVARPSCLDATTNFTVCGTGAGTVTLCWTDVWSCETSYRIEQRRRNSNGTYPSWSLGENVPPNRGNAQRTGLTRGATYQFRLIAVDGGCESDPTNSVTVTVP